MKRILFAACRHRREGRWQRMRTLSRISRSPCDAWRTRLLADNAAKGTDRASDGDIRP
jgi:hypothetical protein